MNGYKIYHDLWLILTFCSIVGWIINLFILATLFKSLKDIWPKLYKLLYFTAFALVCIIVEIIFAELAAAFYTNPIIYTQNIILRLLGRSIEVIGIITAIIARACINLTNKDAK